MFGEPRATQLTATERHGYDARNIRSLQYSVTLLLNQDVLYASNSRRGSILIFLN